MLQEQETWQTNIICKSIPRSQAIMMFNTGNLWVVANLLCTVLLTVQLLHLLNDHINPTITRTWEEEVPLQDIDFPVVVEICLIPGFNQTALNEVGYADAFSYFVGQSLYNSSFYGWAGHMQDLGTIGTVEAVLEHVK